RRATGRLAGQDLRWLAPGDIHGVHAHADLDLAGIHGRLVVRGQLRVSARALLLARGDGAGGAASEQLASQEQASQEQAERRFHTGSCWCAVPGATETPAPIQPGRT